MLYLKFSKKKVMKSAAFLLALRTFCINVIPVSDQVSCPNESGIEFKEGTFFKSSNLRLHQKFKPK